MSVWDHIRCEMPLPGSPAEGRHTFMTQDPPTQFIEDHTIPAAGRLIRHGREWTPRKERPHRDDPNPVRRSIGTFRSVPDQDEEVAFNGDLTFTDRSSVDSPTYVACFVDGRCVRIFLEEEYRLRMEVARRKMLCDFDE